MHLKFNYNKITPYIYLGSNSCCIIHFKKELLAQGITADISMEQERIDQPEGVDFFLWLPTVDHTAPSMKQLVTGVDCITSLLKQKVKMYLHCKNGHGRAPSMLAAYFISQGMTVDEALETIARKRSEIHLENVQVKQLQKFETMIHNNK